MQSHVTNTPLGKSPYRGALTSSAKNQTRIHQVFLDADLRYGLSGLLDLCEKNDIKVKEKPVGNLVVFVNTSKDMIKVIACNETDFPVLAIYRIPAGSPRGRQFDLSIIAEIPKAFQASGRLDIQKAMKDVLERKLGRVVH